LITIPAIATHQTPINSAMATTWSFNCQKIGV
jgi:hypothetical protein